MQITQKPGMPSSDEFWILGSGYLDAGNAYLSLIRNGNHQVREAHVCSGHCCPEDARMEKRR
jgi:hypothetical protein